MSIDPRTFRQTVGQFVTGVTVIAMEVDGHIRALTANSFTSLSLNPPLVPVSNFYESGYAREQGSPGWAPFEAAIGARGVESLIERRAPGLLRLSVGCEHVEDLWTDPERAL